MCGLKESYCAGHRAHGPGPPTEISRAEPPRTFELDVQSAHQCAPRSPPQAWRRVCCGSGWPGGAGAGSLGREGSRTAQAGAPCAGESYARNPRPGVVVAEQIRGSGVCRTWFTAAPPSTPRVYLNVGSKIIVPRRKAVWNGNKFRIFHERWCTPRVHVFQPVQTARVPESWTLRHNSDRIRVSASRRVHL